MGRGILCVYKSLDRRNVCYGEIMNFVSSLLYGLRGYPSSRSSSELLLKLIASVAEL